MACGCALCDDGGHGLVRLMGFFFRELHGFGVFSVVYSIDWCLGVDLYLSIHIAY
jgi:hypothetical protein